MIGDDIGGQSGPLFSPEFYRKIVKPRQKKLVHHIKSLSSARVWYHTCGSVIDYIPDLLDNGIDILNPIQISARNIGILLPLLTFITYSYCSAKVCFFP